MRLESESGMSTAIWAIIYDLKTDGKDDYLRWFHEVHIPEKLARPGYEWAGHYQVLSQVGQAASSQGSNGADGCTGYVALFGGSDTSVFLNPSPAQLKPRQTQETKEMMGRRIASRSFIATTEWRYEVEKNEPQHAHTAILLMGCDVGPNDEDFGAWCVQELKPRLSVAGFQSGCKLLSACGTVRHAILAGFSSIDVCLAFSHERTQSEWSERVHGYTSHMPGSPISAQRIWPAVETTGLPHPEI